MERVRRVALELCTPAERGGVRFSGPKKRRFSEKITLENLEGVDLGELCARLRPAVVFLRQPTGADQSGSRLDVYVPTGVAALAGWLSTACFAVSALSAALAVAILAQRS